MVSIFLRNEILFISCVYFTKLLAWEQYHPEHPVPSSRLFSCNSQCYLILTKLKTKRNRILYTLVCVHIVLMFSCKVLPLCVCMY